MTSRIHVLSEATINRIAAGEVIERPAGVVKELIENAIDAGAGRIFVAASGGGIERIEVLDDGYGMSAAELNLAIQRHATSKLTSGDLSCIKSLGFRGEALPSIGAAARLTLTSRTQADSHAHSIRVEGGHGSQVLPSPGTPGTRAVTEDLFFATPARRKFLKHPRIEQEHIEGTVRRLALAAPTIAFRLECDGRAVLDFPPQSRADRIAAVLGPQAASVLMYVDGQRGGMLLNGFAAAPTLSRASAAGQFLVVNGRPVSDPLLRGAVRGAYRGTIPGGRYPVVALFLEIPTEELDVNVHPAKTELRFRDGAAVRSLIVGTLRKALSVGATAATALRPLRSEPDFVAEPVRTPTGGFAESPLPFEGAFSSRIISPLSPPPHLPLGIPVAQVLDTYIVAVTSDETLILVDQHAAHERLVHETLRAQFADGSIRTQPLLLPAVVELSPADVARVVTHASELSRFGLDVEAFGQNAVLVRALPAILGTPEAGPLLQDLADELAEASDQISLTGQVDLVIARLACHGSIRSGRRLTEMEMNALLRSMEQTPGASTCSHGRPTFLKLSKSDIERWFRRR